MTMCAACDGTPYWHPGGAPVHECECSCHGAQGSYLDPPEGWVTIPKPMEATKAEKAEYMATHRWTPPEGRCINCDVRPGSASSQYPCGAYIPRVLVRSGSHEAKRAEMRVIGAAALGTALFEEYDDKEDM